MIVDYTAFEHCVSEFLDLAQGEAARALEIACFEILRLRSAASSGLIRQGQPLPVDSIPFVLMPVSDPEGQQ